MINRYYSSDGSQPAEDAYDMRKSLSRDNNGVCSKPTGKKIKVSDVEFN
jgi:hypothetical protein